MAISPDAAAPALETVGLSVRYGRTGRLALDDVSLSVRGGEVVGLLGPNGAGKSTLLRTLSGVQSGYTGSARVRGNEVRSLAPRDLARRLAVVPQEPRFEFPFSALEVVLMGRHPHLSGLEFESEADVALARAALARADATDLADRPIDELSAGERQRVVYARALAQDTPVLLLDEPASFLDLRHQVELFDGLRELVAQGRDATGAGPAEMMETPETPARCVLAAIHDLNLAAEYCDRLILLRAGRVLAHGATAEVLTYANLTAAYDTEIYVDLNDLTGNLVVTPLSGRARSRLRTGRDAPRGR